MKISLFFLLGIWVVLGSCGTRKPFPGTVEKLPRSKRSLYRFVVDRNPSFKGMVVSNIQITYQTSENRSKLYGSMKLVRDSALMLSVRSPLGIELSRILYSRDSVKMLDRREKRAFYSDYDQLARYLPLDLTFQALQSLFTGNIPGQYDFTGLPEPTFYRKNISGNELYLGTYKASNPEGHYDFYGWIYKDIARPSYLVYHKDTAEQQYTIEYLDYQVVDAQHFPEKVNIIIKQQHQNRELSLKLGGVRTSPQPSLQLKIPASYKVIQR